MHRDNRRIFRRHTWPILVLTLTVLAGCTPTARAPAPKRSPSPAASLPVPPALAWTSCQGGKFQCATLTVPADYANPTAGTMGVALVRAVAKDQAHRIGSLLTDPGGPGGSGIDFVTGTADTVLGRYRDRFDIVGFDPRGSGKSQPIHCLDSAATEQYLEVDQVPDDATERQALVTAHKQYAAACQANTPRLLSVLAADVVARDMEEMRVALGDAKLTFMGLSYGSLLGATYAELFPTKVRALDLDGVVDPAQDIEGFIRGQAIGYDDALNRFLASCVRAPCAFNADGQGRQKLDAITASVDRAPMKAGTRSIGPGGMAYAVAEGLTSPTRWNTLAQALALAGSGDGRGLLFLFDSYAQRNPDGTYSNLIDIYNAVTCTDRPAPRRIEDFDKIAADLKATAPYFGASTTYASLPCLYWPVTPTGRAHAIAAAGAPPILVVGGTHDPATPYAWAKALAGELQTGRLLTREGDGHVSLGKSQCIDDAVAAYLLDLVVPSPRTVCGAVTPSGQPSALAA
ncbi:MAG: hypothetical protein QOK05_1288 [Chloroflexota bacterium]|jgi:pimeloyl-ACP methyl ester carboxylesterase|nr:hypothetical protein [Chloroflexota bacterium]